MADSIQDLTQQLAALGYRERDSHPVSGGQPIDHLYPAGRRCGIYVLEFENGDLYVGQSKDVVKRYLSHRKRHMDIAVIHFKPHPQADLTAEERLVTRTLEQQGWPMRNISNVTFTRSQAKFDEIMPKDLQDAWIADASMEYFGEPALLDPKHYTSTEARFKKLTLQPNWQTAVEIGSYYLRCCIPAWQQTETSYWSVSCMPTYSEPIYFRFNVGFQMVFDIFRHEDQLVCSWYLPTELAAAGLDNWLKRTNTDDSVSSVAELLKIKRSERWLIMSSRDPNVPDEESVWALTIDPSQLVHGGSDQVVVTTMGIYGAQILFEPEFISACRRFNVGLMQKSRVPGRYVESHCLDLADLMSDIIFSTNEPTSDR